MNIGQGRWKSKYICDKCGNEISYIGQKGFVGINRYCKNTYRNPVYKKDFDLCKTCEKKFREWLETKEIETPKEIVARFPIYK